MAVTEPGDDGCLTRDAILACEDDEKLWVLIPEWGGGLFVRTFNGAERDALDKMKDRGDPIRGYVCVKACIDEDGAQIFSMKDIQKIGRKSGVPLDRIIAAATEVNKVGDDEFDEMVGNSEATPESDSGSN